MKHGTMTHPVAAPVRTDRVVRSIFPNLSRTI